MNDVRKYRSDRCSSHWAKLLASSMHALMLIVQTRSADAQTTPTTSAVGNATARDVARPPRLVSALPTLTTEFENGTDFVVVELVIDRDGNVESAQVIDASHAELGPSVADALRAAQFSPAERGGETIRARIRYRYLFRPASPATPPPVETVWQDVEDASSSPSANSEAVTESVEEASPSDETFAYTATADSAAPEPGARHLTLEEMRELPGALGDPFRAIDILPGVTPVLTGLPFFYIRGAPPSGNAFYFDGIPVPGLFHFGIGAAVIHPRMIDSVDVHNGVAPARYGRHFGAVIAGQAPTLRITRARGEAELRAIDVSAYVETPITRDWTVQGAVRVGYPAYLISVFAPNFFLSYWDYQARTAYHLNTSERLELVTFGSFDEFTQRDEISGEVTFARLWFVRNELRYRRQQDGWDFGAAMRVGYEESAGGTLARPFSVSTMTLGPRLWWNSQHALPFEVRSGIELMGSVGAATFSDENIFGNFTGDNSKTAFGLARMNGNAFIETRFRPTREFTLDVGVRGDLWTNALSREVSVAPRLRAEYRLHENVAIQGGAGLAQQPALVPLPLPGLSDLPVSRGLQTGYQSDLGVAVDFGTDFHADARGFLHRYEQLIFADLLPIPSELCWGGANRGDNLERPCVDIPRRDNINATAYGLEIMLRARVETLRVLGSYTFAQVVGEQVHGVDVTPSYDVRHVANLAFEWEPDTGWILSLRGHFRTGGMGALNYLTPQENGPGLTPALRFNRYEQRMPSFARVDISISHRWDAGWSKLRVGLEIINAIPVFQEAGGLNCVTSNTEPGVPIAPCPTLGSAAFPIPNLYLRSVLE